MIFSTDCLQAFVRRFAPMAVAIVVGLFASGCASAFQRDWKTAGSQANPAHSLEGRWLGQWKSEETGHGGRLRCIVTSATNGAYQARFHAKYRRFLSFSYSVPLTVEIRNGLARFKGAVDLGTLAGGVYFYEGDANGARFFSKYKSQNDHGTFEMRRP